MKSENYGRKVSQTRYCGRCHQCGHNLRMVLDGEEWCDHCENYRRYFSHGWALGLCDEKDEQCPPQKQLDALAEAMAKQNNA